VSTQDRWEIRQDDLQGEAIQRLLREHLEHMLAITPWHSAHVLDIEALRAPEITFWSLWESAELLGCGALKKLDERTGEVKSMRTADAHRGRGVAGYILEHIEGEALRRGYERLCLETGSFEAFLPAQRLYVKHGYVRRGPFGTFREDPNTVFMEKILDR
jgi:putative acetyltransferase